ncbi:eukaryotic porin/Tom40 [Lophiotrema nucula]|uniref:Eukaryotic porin/Tom40 n=1 Tax=Lophiotrema nucula TaxID=690887 RepID=A0A6A5ZTS7_9PLEO|nr:eukaryotic porin/Tom40 [Lophiotrema nucula]
MDLEKERAVAEIVGQNNSILGRLQNVYSSFQERREALGLSNPGTVENIAKEVQKDVFLNNMSFSGLRADLTKAFGVAPLFQVSHALSMGSQAQPPYTYAAIYGSPRVFLQANLDNDLSFSGRFNWRWTNAWVTKTSVQLTSQGNMVSLENDYTGADFTASLKALNPSILDGGVTGMVMASYLQSVTPRLSLGLDTFWNRPAMAYPPDLTVSYAARYKAADWVASAQFLAAGGIEASYWKRLSDKVETGISLNLQFAGIGPNGPMGGVQKEGTVTIGSKYDFRASSVRAQVDSKGKVGVLLERIVAPAIRVSFSGEIDHKQSTSKLGLAVSIDAADPEIMEQQETKVAVDAPPIPF